MSEIKAINKERIQGFVRLELYDKDGNLKNVNEHNMITIPAKSLMFMKSAGEIIDMNDTVWGHFAKQGVSFNGYGYNNSNKYKAVKRKSALTNVLLSLSADQLAAINTETRFINIYNNDFNTASRVLGYANMSTIPLSNGKEGSLEYQKGEDVMTKNIMSKKFRYPDGVATGTINAIAMLPYSCIVSPYGTYIDDDSEAPGFRIARCIDKVNFRDANFSEFSTGYCPPGVAGITSETEIISNYSMNGYTQHKINLVTGEVTDIETPDSAIPMLNNGVNDYIVDGDYLYILFTSGSNSKLTVYQISTKTQVYSGNLYSSTSLFQKFLMINGALYVCSIPYAYSGNVLYKLGKSSKDYYNTVDSKAPDYSALLTLPAGLTPYNVCFQNYGNKYIMYVDRNTGNASSSRNYAAGYIFSDLNNITSTIEDCIPSVRSTDIVFKNTSVGGILSLGINRDSSIDGIYTDSIYNSYIYTNIDGTTASADLRNKALFFNVEGNWTNLVSIAVLNGANIVEKGATDVLYVTYGYKIN